MSLVEATAIDLDFRILYSNTFRSRRIVVPENGRTEKQLALTDDFHMRRDRSQAWRAGLRHASASLAASKNWVCITADSWGMANQNFNDTRDTTFLFSITHDQR